MNKPKSKEISTKIFKFDMDFIVNNYLDQRLWNKTWTIFEYDGLTLTMQLKSIDLQERRIIYWITGKDDKNTYINKYCWNNYIPIDLKEEDKKFYLKSFHRVCLDVIQTLEYKKIIDSDAYRLAQQNESDYDDSLRDVANDFLDENNVTNKDIREAYIDAYVSDNRTNEYTQAVLKSQMYFKYSRYFLTLSLYFGREDLYDEYKGELDRKGKGTSELRSAIMKCVNFKKKLENGDFREEMESSLEDI